MNFSIHWTPTSVEHVTILNGLIWVIDRNNVKLAPLAIKLLDRKPVRGENTSPIGNLWNNGKGLSTSDVVIQSQIRFCLLFWFLTALFFACTCTTRKGYKNVCEGLPSLNMLKNVSSFTHMCTHTYTSIDNRFWLSILLLRMFSCYCSFSWNQH